VVAGKEWWPRKPSDFEEGDIIVGQGGSYPRDALEVRDVGMTFIRAYPLGGGFQYKFGPEAIRRYRFRKASPEELKAKIYKASFTMDLMEGESFEGWTYGDLWNGWGTPHFDEAEARRMLRAMGRSLKEMKSPFSWKYDRADDAFVIAGDEERDEEIFSGEWVETPEGRKKLYGIGAYAWTWNETDPIEYEEEDE
jgi:hypothetical protein